MRLGGDPTPEEAPPPTALSYEEVGVSVWSSDIRGTLQASQKVAWIVAGCATLLAAVEAVALGSLSSVPQVLAYTIKVDPRTGYIRPEVPFARSASPPDAEMLAADAAQYVIARESHDEAHPRHFLALLRAWSEPTALRETLDSRPTAPADHSDPRQGVSVVIHQITPYGAHAFAVAFDKVRRDERSVGTQTGSWTSQVKMAVRAYARGSAVVYAPMVSEYISHPA